MHHMIKIQNDLLAACLQAAVQRLRMRPAQIACLPEKPDGDGKPIPAFTRSCRYATPNLA
jgi:hypothetical protein